MTARRAIVVRHLAFEDLGSLGDLLDARGYRLVELEAGVDDLSAVEVARGDLLVVLGGPIGAYDDERYPFLRDELRLIERALTQQSATLGICLGAQLLARALGARVYPAEAKEIGIGPVALTSDGRSSCLEHLAPDYRVLHWHGDTFDLPTGAVRLASTDMTPNQAFAFGRQTLGLQFHIEADPAAIERWLIGHTAELAASRLDVNQLRAALRAHLPAIAPKGRAAFGAWLAAAG